MGGASTRFGSAKALATLDGETLAERAWRILGAACEERIAVGKTGELELPFPLLDDGAPIRAPLAGVVAGLRAAAHDVAVFLPIDCPRITVAALRSLGEACRDAAVPQTGPLPGAYSKSALPVLERRLATGALAIKDAVPELDAATVELDAGLLANVNSPRDLAALSSRRK